MDLETPAISDQNPTADTARACIVYSLVPYLGIVFIPIALGVSGFGYVRARQKHKHEPHRFVFCAGLSLVVLAVQVFLWWLLYFIPKIGV
ncbi:MAG: hypothetical protein ABI646_00965 [Acidobacteriota bacterium]